MSDSNGMKLGALIRSYARERWGDAAHDNEADAARARLDPEIRERIDALGLDAERLLRVEDSDALAELQALEKEAAKEDAGAKSRADKVRACEESYIRGQAKAPWRDHEAYAGMGRQPARHSRRRRRSRR